MSPCGVGDLKLLGEDGLVLHPGAAAAEAWVETVAGLLPWPFRAPAPFTLCEAAEELGAWARFARHDAWSRKENFQSLADDVIASRKLLGPRMRAATDKSVHILTTAFDRTSIAAAAVALEERWREPAIVVAAFEDLCDAARNLTSPHGGCGLWQLSLPRRRARASRVAGVCFGRS